MRRVVSRLAEHLSADNTAPREQLRVEELEAGRQLQEQQQFFENKMLQQHFSFAQAQSLLQFKLQSLLQESEQQLAAAQEKLRATVCARAGLAFEQRFRFGPIRLGEAVLELRMFFLVLPPPVLGSARPRNQLPGP